MPEFIARIHDTPQGVRSLRVQAEHAGAVAQALGVDPRRLLSVAPAQVVGAARRHQALSPRLFAQELAVLLQAGVPLLEALVTLREKDSSAQVLDTVLEALRAGQPLSVALAREPRAFDELFIAVVAASERSGQLALTLRDHAAYLGWSESLRARLVAAAVYPLMLLAAGGAVVLFLLLYVLPRFAGVFEGIGKDLPPASQALIHLGVAAHAHPAVAVSVALALPALAFAVWRAPAARAAAAALMWRSRFVGPRLRVVALARLYRCLALLLSAGVPVVGALRLAQGVVPLPLRDGLGRTVADVASGQRLSQALLDAGLATPVALRMLRVGESTGEVAAMFAQAAAFHDEEIARLSELVTRTVNPLLMLVMGTVIGGIVVLMYLPIFTLMEQVQ